MNALLGLLFVVSSCAAALPQYAAGRRVYSFTSRAALQSPLTCLASPIGAQCGTDCRTMMVCNGIAGSSPVFSQTCVSINPKLPYCVNGACTATPSTSAEANCGKAFTCTSAGTFPDPTDCSKYRICPSVGGDAVLYTCPANYAYNTALNLCSLQYSCNVIDCTNINNAITLYRGNSAIYAFCKTGLTAEILMFKCADTQNEIYDIAAGSCRYNCKSTGIFPDRSNCNGYISCDWFNGKWNAAKQSCPTGYQFKNNACIAEGTVACVSEIAPATAPKEDDQVNPEDDQVDPEVVL